MALTKIPKAPYRTSIVWFDEVDTLKEHTFIRGWWRKLNEGNNVCPHCGKANQIYRCGWMFGADLCEACQGTISWWPNRKRKSEKSQYYAQPDAPHRQAYNFELRINGVL